MAVKLEFVGQRDGGWDYAITSDRLGVQCPTALCWRKGTQNQITEYHEARFVARHHAVGYDVLAPKKTAAGKTKKSVDP